MSEADVACGVVRFFVMSWWLLAVVGKIANFDAFAASLSRSFINSPLSPRALAVFVCSAEALAVVLLASGATAQAGLFLSMLLSLLFAVTIAVALLKNIGIVCNCFGSSEHKVGSLDLGRNLLVMLASGMAMILGSEQYVMVPPYAVISFLVGFSLSLILSRIHDFIWLTSVKIAD